MAASKEIEKELTLALKEIGEIKPWYDSDLKDWVFAHPLYPVECGGITREEVIENYPLYLKEFITQRIDQNLDPLVEKKTKGHGGYRKGAGRPKGTSKEETHRVSLPKHIAVWLMNKNHISLVEKLMCQH